MTDPTNQPEPGNLEPAAWVNCGGTQVAVADQAGDVASMLERGDKDTIHSLTGVLPGGHLYPLFVPHEAIIFVRGFVLEVEGQVAREEAMREAQAQMQRQGISVPGGVPGL